MNTVTDTGKPISFADLVGEDPQPREATLRKRGRPALPKDPVVEETQKKLRKAAKTTASALVPRSDRFIHDPETLSQNETARRLRESRIRSAVESALKRRITSNVKPLEYRSMALELAHYSIAHLGAESLQVIERIAEYARDPDSEHHEWALKFLGERVLPTRLAQEAMLHAAGLSEDKGGGNRAPTIVINVGEAQPIHVTEQHVIDVVPVEEKK